MSEVRNALENASSAYLRSAMHQPVQWHEWGAEAFALAMQQDKPILLDIGAVWCHWCHVMDRESYEDAKLAEVINDLFIAIKVDRDERPDVDSRYQAAVSAIAGQGGWPLTGILTPDGRPFFGGTYFPREERYGRPGFERVLRTMANVWQTQRAEALESAESVIAAIRHGETFAGRSGQLSQELVGKLIDHAIAQFDEQHGGFGSQPKFPHPSALDMLLDAEARAGNQAAGRAARVTLTRMAQGGIYDQLAGGFHRYSVDERWVVPHFEKMLYDNAELLKNYVHLFQHAEDHQAAAVARDILRWMDEWLTDQERGGYYASQDADLSLDDDGDYFTWTREEAAAVLAGEELTVTALYYDIGPVGDMHHNPLKNVLHRRLAIADVAARLSLPTDEVTKLLDSAKRKLYAARLERPTPFIDKTIYTGWNALAISAGLQAGRVLGIPEQTAFALKTLGRILQEGWSAETGLAHVIAYAGGHAPAARVAGVLDDYAFLVHACIDAWEATGERSWFDYAAAIADAMIERFYDRAGDGFFDAESVGSPEALGALATERKPLQDSPTPAGNPAAAAALLRLEALNGRSEYRDKAEDTLEAFAGIIEHFGLYAGTYGLALQRLLASPIQVVIVGAGEDADRLEAAAHAGFLVNKSVLRFKHGQLNANALPPLLAETLPGLPAEFLNPPAAFAVVCRNHTCMPPTRDAAALRSLLTA